jgi:hypothetical protein
VWADANTRAAIFDALRRRETFATSGPRIRVRLFAGWGSAEGLANGADWARAAYRWGVPMGGNLTAPPAGSHGPSFVVQAAKDPFSGNLDRIQIVKLWRRGGQSFEKIYDVAWSPAAGSTATAARAGRQHGRRGEGDLQQHDRRRELVGTWRDPDFDPSERALYYAA